MLPPERFTASGGFGAQAPDQVDSALVLRELADDATIRRRPLPAQRVAAFRGSWPGTSIHLTIGVAALTGADVVRELVAEISREPGAAGPAAAQRQ